MSEGTTTGTVSFTGTGHWSSPELSTTHEVLRLWTWRATDRAGHFLDTPVLLHDSLGSTRALLSSSGSVAATFTFTASGMLASSSGTATTPLLYAGSYFDAASNFYYLVHRYYDPQTGSS